MLELDSSLCNHVMKHCNAMSFHPYCPSVFFLFYFACHWNLQQGPHACRFKGKSARPLKQTGRVRCNTVLKQVLYSKCGLHCAWNCSLHTVRSIRQTSMGQGHATLGFIAETSGHVDSWSGWPGVALLPAVPPPSFTQRRRATMPASSSSCCLIDDTMRGRGGMDFGNVHWNCCFC